MVPTGHSSSSYQTPLTEEGVKAAMEARKVREANRPESRRVEHESMAPDSWKNVSQKKGGRRTRRTRRSRRARKSKKSRRARRTKRR